MNKFASRAPARALMLLGSLLIALVMSPESMAQSSQLTLGAGPGLIGSDLTVKLPAKLGCKSVPNKNPTVNVKSKKSVGASTSIECEGISDEFIGFYTLSQVPLPCMAFDDGDLEPAETYTDSSGQVACYIDGNYLRTHKALLQDLLQRGYLAVYGGIEECGGQEGGGINSNSRCDLSINDLGLHAIGAIKKAAQVTIPGP